MFRLIKSYASSPRKHLLTVWCVVRDSVRVYLIEFHPIQWPYPLHLRAYVRWLVVIWSHPHAWDRLSTLFCWGFFLLFIPFISFRVEMGRNMGEIAKMVWSLLTNPISFCNKFHLEEMTITIWLQSSVCDAKEVVESKWRIIIIMPVRRVAYRWGEGTEKSSTDRWNRRKSPWFALAIRFVDYVGQRHTP